MAVALEAGYELGVLALCYVAIALLLVVIALVQAGVHIIDFSLFGYRPLHGVAVALTNTVVSALDDAIRGCEATAAKFESGLIDALGLVVGIPLLLAFGVKAAFQYLWNHALIPLIHSITDTIATTAHNALTKVTDLAGTVAENLTNAKRYAEGQAAGALADAKAFVRTEIGAAEHTLRGEISSALTDAERFANQAVAKLQGIEDAAIADAVGLAAAAKTAGLAAAADALAEAERVAGKALGIEEAARVQAIATAEAAGAEAVKAVRSVAIDLGEELHQIEGAFGAAGLATLIASIPALGLLVHTIATEAGLEKAECRSKVKEVCTTDPIRWSDLLAGLAALGFAFSLKELVEIAEPLVAELGPIIAEAA